MNWTHLKNIEWESDKRRLPFQVIPPLIIGQLPDKDIIKWLEDLHQCRIKTYIISRHGSCIL